MEWCAGVAACIRTTRHPSAAFTTNPATVNARLPVSFAGSATDSDGDTLTYAWDLGAQFPLEDGASILPTFAFGGSYPLTLRVSDGRGGLTILNHNVTVTDPARTFTQRTSGTTDDLEAIAAHSTLAVAAGDNGRILTSPDGVTWTARSVPEFAENITFYAATWNGSRFLLAGQDYSFDLSAWVGVIYSSTDGITWTRRHRSTTLSSAFYAIAAIGNGAVVAGDSGVVCRSTDEGLTWSNAAISGVTSVQTFDGLATNGTIFALTGYTNSNGGAKVFTSTDGSNWIDRSAGAGVASWQDLRDDRLAQRPVRCQRLVFQAAHFHRRSPNLHHHARPHGGKPGDGLRQRNLLQRRRRSRCLQRRCRCALLGRDHLVFVQRAHHRRSRGSRILPEHLPHGRQRRQHLAKWRHRAPSGFLVWQATHFPAGGTHSLAESDPDFDGVANLAEYSLTRNPNSGNGGDGPSGAGNVLWNSGQGLAPRRPPEPAPADVTYTVQGANHPSGSWTNLAQKSGAGSWIWLGTGTARIATGSVTSGRLPVRLVCPTAH